MDQELAHYPAEFSASAFAVKLDMGGFKPIQASLVLAWLEIWLKLHCQSGWKITFHEALTSGDRNGAKVEFEDGREAMLFKLSPEFLLYQGQGSSRALQFISLLH